MKISKRTSWAITDDKLREWIVKFEPCEWLVPIIRELDSGNVVVGYLCLDPDAFDPLEDCDGMGKIYDGRRWSRSYEDFQAAMADYQGTEDTLAVMLDVYSHSGEVWSIQGKGMNDRWDTSKAAGVWVPDDCCLEHIQYTAKERGVTERAIALECAEQALESYNDYIAGNTFSVCVEEFEPDGARVSDDACWGHTGVKWAEQALAEAVGAV